jgi:integrase
MVPDLDLLRPRRVHEDHRRLEPEERVVLRREYEGSLRMLDLLASNRAAPRPWAGRFDVERASKPAPAERLHIVRPQSLPNLRRKFHVRVPIDLRPTNYCGAVSHEAHPAIVPVARRDGYDGGLLECADVPLLRRLAYGFLTREGMRTDELARLTWADVDLVHNRVDLDENKTDKPRSWDLRPDVLAAMAIWRAQFRKSASISDHVFVDDDGVGLNVDHLATQLRDDLKRAEVDRPKLFTGSRNRLRMRAHDLRATFITVSLASQRTWEWCQHRTGHGDSMKRKYRRAPPRRGRRSGRATWRRRTSPSPSWPR